MKVKNGEPFVIRTANCIATVTVENFNQKIVDEFNRLLVEEAMRQIEMKDAVA